MNQFSTRDGSSLLTVIFCPSACTSFHLSERIFMEAAMLVA